MALTVTPPSALPRPDTQHPRLSLARIPVSATLAANETMDERRRRGEPVLPLAFGEAGLPAHRTLRAALARAAGCNSYGPVAGHASLREAAAGYWARRGLPTDADAVICGPGSKALLFGLMAAIGGPGTGVAVTRPSWVSYAAQAALSGRKAHFVPGTGGVPDADQLARAVTAARAAGNPIRSVIVTLPDNPTGLLAPAAAVRDLCSVAEAHDLVIISDEIYRDLVHDPDAPFTSPAVISPERTVVTSRAEQEPRPGRLAPRRGQAARRRVRARAARPAARHRQRDLVRPGRAGAAGRRARLQRAAGGGRPGRAQPPPARVGGPGGGAHVRRGRGSGARAAGGVLRLPGLLAAGRRAARAARHHQRRGPGRDAAARVRRGGAAGQRVRRGRRAAAAAGGHGHALRRHRRPSGSPR